MPLEKILRQRCDLSIFIASIGVNPNPILMRNLFLATLLTFFSYSAFPQTSLEALDLKSGEYSVGFKHYTATDSTRRYHRIFDYTTQSIPRPIPISIWYPAKSGPKASEKLKVLDYFKILAEEAEEEYLPEDQFLNWFAYSNTPANQAHLLEETHASFDLDFAGGRFPVVIYAPGMEGTSIENFALAEMLASYGYIVIASPSRGTETRFFRKANMETETQARDIEFLLQEISKYPAANLDKIAVMGHSLGGLAGMLAQVKNDQIKAAVSLDGSERYNPDLLKESAFFEMDKVNIPYLHMAQKAIPEEFLISDQIDPSLNTNFLLFDELTQSEAFKMRFHHLRHAQFTTMGVLFDNRDPRQDKSDAEIIQSHQLLAKYSLNFLDSYLKNNSEASAFLQDEVSDNGIDSNLISIERKSAPETSFTFADFNMLARAQEYQDLSELYSSVKTTYPELEIPEGNLNTIGLQLIFNPKTSAQAIRVFNFAATLYPNSANLYDSMAEAYLFLGDREKAISAFEKSLELNPQNQNAINRIKELKD